MSEPLSSKTVAIKACPFCGSQPEFRESNDDDCEFWLGCMECVIAPYLAMNSKEDCIAYWNIRENARSAPETSQPTQEKP